jgi:Mn-dependent DtxR family transcriptional regulator
MAKTVNYTDAQLEVLRAEYVGNDNAVEVAAIAEKLGKTPASVRAKLANLGIYKPHQKSEETERVTKIVIAEAIGQKIGLLEAETEGLAKAPKAALDKILHALA